MSHEVWLDSDLATRQAGRIGTSAAHLASQEKILHDLAQAQGPEKWGTEPGAVRLASAFSTVLTETAAEVERIEKCFQAFKDSVAKAAAHTEQVDAEALADFTRHADALQAAATEPAKVSAADPAITGGPAEFGASPGKPVASQPIATGGAQPAAPR